MYIWSDLAGMKKAYMGLEMKVGCSLAVEETKTKTEKEKQNVKNKKTVWKHVHFF